MTNWLNRLRTFFFRKGLSMKKLEEKYVLEDSAYLKRAFNLGPEFIKRRAALYLGFIVNQDNFDFLIRAIRNSEDKRLKAVLYVALLNMVKSQKLSIAENDAMFLNQNLDPVGGI